MKRIILLAYLLLSITSCTVVGNGKDTLVKAGVSATDWSRLDGVFSHLLIEDSVPVESRAVSITPGAPEDYQTYRLFIEKKYGDPNFDAAKLNVTTRNRNVTPPFLPIDLKALLTGKIADLALDGKATIEQKIEREEFLKARLLDVPSLTRATTLHHIEEIGANKGRKFFFYYPRISVDFSSTILSASQLDRFSFLGMAMKLRNPPESMQCGQDDSGVRFIDHAPKAADIVEYTRGSLTQKNEMTAKASAGLARTRGEEAASSLGTTEIEGTDTTAESDAEKLIRSRNVNFGSDLSVSRSETYVNE